MIAALPLVATAASTALTAGGQLAQGIGQRREAKQALQFQAQQRQAAYEQFTQQISRANSRISEERASAAQKRDAERRQFLETLGVMENRSAASGTTGGSVNQTISTVFSDLARQQNTNAINSRLLEVRDRDLFQDLQGNFANNLNQLSRPVEKPSLLPSFLGASISLADGVSNFGTTRSLLRSNAKDQAQIKKNQERGL